MEAISNPIFLESTVALVISFSFVKGLLKLVNCCYCFRVITEKSSKFGTLFSLCHFLIHSKLHYALFL